MTHSTGKASPTQPAVPDRIAVDALFCRALDVPAAERDALVERECAGDEVLLAAVKRLLRAERASASAFDAAAESNVRLLEGMLAEPATDKGDPRIGQNVGAFRLVRRIGQGGMAIVYLAERADGQFAQRVAIKLLRRTVDDAEDVARFRAERHILSALEHPTIARLIDGGTTADGQPYLATEFVEGLPITEYCALHELTIEARLDLFLQVADAVHYAHRNLVVHRDLKPSNVMVDADGRVRLLDFGIAKLIDPEQQSGDMPLTRIGHAVMTPEYAAPEQFTGGEVTTATDVYQLGILLHELLTGARPKTVRGLDDSTHGAMRRPSTQVEAGSSTVPPADRARLARRLRGDLDVILQTALQRESQRRYASVAAFADDLRCHLGGRPIAARPETTLELLGRITRRSPYAVAAAALAVLLLIGWVVSLQVYSRELATERDAAEAQAMRTDRAYGLLLDIFRRADPLDAQTVGGRSATVWDSLDAAADSARATLRDEPETLAELLGTIAQLYRAQNQAAKSRELLLELLGLQRQLHGADSAPVAITLGELGSLENQLGNSTASLAYLDQAVHIAKRVPREQASDVVAVFLDAGHTANSVGDAQAAERHFEYAELLLRESLRPDPNALIEVLFGRGNALRHLGALDRAEPLILESVRLTEQGFGAEHARLAGPLSALGSVQNQLGQYELAVATFRRAIPIMEREYGASYDGLLAARNNLALALGAAGDPRAEQAELARLIELKRSKGAGDNPMLANWYQNLGVSLTQTGDHDAALDALNTAQRIYDTNLPQSSARRAFPRLSSALIHLQTGDAGAAARSADKAVAILKDTLPDGHYATAIGQCLLAEALIALGETARGAELVRAALPFVERAPPSQIGYVTRCRAVSRRIAPSE